MSPKIVYILLIIIVLGDILSSIAYSLNWGFSNFGMIIKIPIELFFLIYSIKFIKSNLLVSAIFIFIIIWLIGMATCFFNLRSLTNSDIDTVFSENENIYLESFKVLNRYIFFFVLSVIMYLYSNDLSFVIDVKKLFEWFVIVNSICIILGFFFNIVIFSSYNPNGKITDFETRFGYKGVLFGINEIAGVCFLAISHFYRETILYKKRGKIVVLLLVIFSSLLTGTKGTLIAVIMVTAYYLYRYFKRLFYFVFLPSISLSVFILISRYSEMIMSALSTISKSDSLLTLLSSGRSDHVIMNLDYIGKHWFLLNYIFGDGVLYTETDLLDLYFFFGIFSILYMFFYTKLFMKFEKTTDKVPIYILMLLLAFTNGHMIQSAVFPVFLLLYLISSRDTPYKLKNEDSLRFNVN